MLQCDRDKFKDLLDHLHQPVVFWEVGWGTQGRLTPQGVKGEVICLQKIFR